MEDFHEPYTVDASEPAFVIAENELLNGLKLKKIIAGGSDSRYGYQGIWIDRNNLLACDGLVKYQKQLKKFIKSQSQKVMLIFDESDSITNPYAKRTKAVLSVFRKCRRKYEMTGTSTRNNIYEIAPQLELLYNNSINYLSLCETIYTVDKENNINEEYNRNCGKPFPAYKKGYNFFSYSHMPNTVSNLKHR